MTRVLIALTEFFASAALAVALALFLGWPVAILSGALAFLFSRQIEGGWQRRRDRRATQRELTQLRRITLECDRSLNATRLRIDNLGAQFESRTEAQGRKIVSELKLLEGLMKEFASRVAKSARAAQDRIVPEELMQTGRRQGSVSAYVADMGDDELLETIRASLEDNRIDLYLQPIVSLPQRKLRYYEALSRLRAEDGQVIMPAQYMKVAGPAGLMSVVDNLLLFRCVQVVRRLTQKSRGLGMFCNISPETLADGEFFPQFLDYMQANRDLAAQIVFEFSQSAVAKAGVQGEMNLARLSGLGFALSMDHVESLALDYVKLKAMGFRHLKVPAAMLVGGTGATPSEIAPEDLKTLLARHGLNLVAERVEEERTVVQLLEYGVDYAEGYLFGEPRALREEPKAPHGEAAPVVPLRKAG